MCPVLLELAGFSGGSQTLFINCWSQVEQSCERLAQANLIQPGRGEGTELALDWGYRRDRLGPEGLVAQP